VSRSIEVDVATEDAALAHYATTLELVGETDRGLTALIARIIDDEHHHRAGFARLADRIAADGDAAHSAKPDIDPKDFAVIGPVIATEYGGTLQYILNKSGVGDCDAADTYFELAVDEMRHILWAASYTAGFGEPQAPPPPPDWVAYPAGEDDALRMATELERRAEPFYTAMVSQASDTRLKSDLGRAGGNHDYHRHLLAVMSKGPEEPASR
jgi:rubrerythrin